MHLLLIRHGQSTNNLAAESGTGESDREPDPPLTPLGEQQAAALADWLSRAEWVPDHLYASLMRRTIQTAAPLADRFGLRIEARDNLHEAGGPYVGPYLEATPHPGSTRAELQAFSPVVDLPDVVTDAGWWSQQVETTAVAFQRARSVGAWLWEQARHRQDGERVAIVAHGAFLSMLVTTLVNPAEAAAAADRRAGGAEDLPVWYEFENTSTSLIDLQVSHTRQTASVAWLNRVDHLDSLPARGATLTSNPFPPAPAVPAQEIS